MTDPSIPSREYDLMRSRWRQMRDFVSGSKVVKEMGETYLPSLAGHRQGPQLTTEYVAYKDRALVYGAVGRTIDGLSGMVFRRPPIVDLPPAADALIRDVDMQGRKVEDFADSVLREVLTTGRCGILIDHTRQEDFSEGRVGSGQPLEVRPYAALYQTEAILDVVYERVGGARRLVQVRLGEVMEVPGEEEFQTRTVQIVRVLELVEGVYQQRIFEAREERDSRNNVVTTFGEREDLAAIPTLPDGTTLDFIPFWVVGTGASAIPGEIEVPPLLDLSDVNLCHYRLDADYRNGLHACGVPTPVFIGIPPPPEPVRLGTFEGIFLENSDADAKFLSYGGEGIVAIKDALADLEQQMANLGARILQPDKRGVEAADTARIHRMGEVSILARLSNVVSNSLTGAVKFMLEWAGINTNDQHQVRLNDDFLPTQAAPQLLAEMVKSWQSGAISHDSLWLFMQEGELVDPRRTVEEERAIIEDEAPEPELEEQELGLEQQRIGVEQQRLSLEQQRDGQDEQPEAA